MEKAESHDQRKKALQGVLSQTQDERCVTYMSSEDLMVDQNKSTSFSQRPSLDMLAKNAKSQIIRIVNQNKGSPSWALRAYNSSE